MIIAEVRSNNSKVVDGVGKLHMVPSNVLFENGVGS